MGEAKSKLKQVHQSLSEQQEQFEQDLANYEAYARRRIRLAFISGIAFGMVVAVVLVFIVKALRA